ncbi:hypothetical protein [Sphingomonas solaris]|uniref:Uncharacterized protein n=1 Tax=Alterirhizorhabdus solaris TaxID=2529389 RepID=A0A558RE48_9SPHN|nr:hypothetical protein [Sphingomonas solaris]TVV77462.1 hypothetical protein FOY91_00010 [Sphingomonas solaris]
MSAPPGFGAYLANVQERDVDLLLMEEFHVDGRFVEWFCDRVGGAGARFDGASHSVTDADGETDLLLQTLFLHRKQITTRGNEPTRRP